MKTLKQKLYALALVAVGVVSTILLEEGVGVLILSLMFAIPLFFSKKNWLWD